MLYASALPGLDKLAEQDWQYVEKQSLEDFEPDDWRLLSQQRAAYYQTEFPRHVLRMLSSQKDDPTFGYKINNYNHCLQAATRMMQADLPDEDIVVGLLHDVGFIACNQNHGEVAAMILKPYISERNEWMLRHHAVFQQLHCTTLEGCDLNARDKWQGHPHFEWTAEFVSRFDQDAIRHDEEIYPLEAFEPLVMRILSTPAK